MKAPILTVVRLSPWWRIIKTVLYRMGSAAMFVCVNYLWLRSWPRATHLMLVSVVLATAYFYLFDLAWSRLERGVDRGATLVADENPES